MLANETRIIRISPRARLARLSPADRQLLMLLVSLGADEARDRLAMLASDRREELAPLVAEVSALADEDRHALFAVAVSSARPNRDALNAKLRRERPRVASLLAQQLSPRRAQGNVVPAQPEPTFGRTVAAIARRWAM